MLLVVVSKSMRISKRSGSELVLLVLLVVVYLILMFLVCC